MEATGGLDGSMMLVFVYIFNTIGHVYERSGARGKSILGLDVHIQNILICMKYIYKISIYVSSLPSQADCTDEKVLLPMLFTRTTHSSVQSALLFNVLNILVV